MVRQALIAPWRALCARAARARVVFFPWRASRRREWWRFPLWCVGRSSFAVVEGLLTDVGLGVLGWGFTTRGGVRFVEWTSRRRAGLTAFVAYVFEGGPSVLRWVLCLGALALVARLCWRVSLLV